MNTRKYLLKRPNCGIVRFVHGRSVNETDWGSDPNPPFFETNLGLAQSTTVEKTSADNLSTRLRVITLEKMR